MKKQKITSSKSLLATKEDLQKTEKAIKAGLQLDLNDFKQEINERINLLPTKDEFFNKMDQVMGELKTIYEEQTVISGQLPDHKNRITALEQKAGIKTL